MGLETSNGIWELNTSWPLGSDYIREGDNHFRNLKLAIVKTFPQITGPVTVTQQQLNSLGAVSGSVDAWFNELIDHIEAVGSIKMWDIANRAIPAGWVVANGAAVVGYGTVPDMRDRFVIGAAGGLAAGAVGGSYEGATGAAGSHTHINDETVLSIAQIPAHSHRIWAWNHGNDQDSDNKDFTSGNRGVTGPVEPLGHQYMSRSGSDAGTPFIEETGGSLGHTHGMQEAGAHAHTVSFVPPYYAALFIVKVAGFQVPV